MYVLLSTQAWDYVHWVFGMAFLTTDLHTPTSVYWSLFLIRNLYKICKDLSREV